MEKETTENIPECKINPFCLQPPVCALAGQCEGSVQDKTEEEGEVE